jgi:hypothetical protein
MCPVWGYEEQLPELKAIQDIGLMHKSFPKSNYAQIIKLKERLFPELRAIQVIQSEVVIP